MDPGSDGHVLIGGVRDWGQTPISDMIDGILSRYYALVHALAELDMQPEDVLRVAKDLRELCYTTVSTRKVKVVFKRVESRADW